MLRDLHLNQTTDAHLLGHLEVLQEHGNAVGMSLKEFAHWHAKAAKDSITVTDAGGVVLGFGVLTEINRDDGWGNVHVWCRRNLPPEDTAFWMREGIRYFIDKWELRCLVGSVPETHRPGLVLMQRQGFDLYDLADGMVYGARAREEST